MAKYNKIQVLEAMMSTGIVPVFYNADLEVSKNVLNPKFAFINLDELYKICSSEQIIKACASYLANAVGISQTPDLTQVNQMLAKQAWLNGIPLRCWDSWITTKA